ncbi:helix-turn-helix domain-containing protein [Flavimaricola marinus]|uniref:DNA-binding transcriptional regulator AraC n=1 Tax=Flavimaricola marinus TaxID=1819565 RepID=A0A238LDS4_9RHOB|nr:helix-turn-helix domain-containing protein [Flavimaricola marinus]SMY07574.1 DNA-binding transcriptional regulator AraC [Flavimaricola marinus]
MDKIVDFPLDTIPTQSLNLRLARSPIPMRHTPRWKIDKINPVHDLVVCLSGRGAYQIGGEEVEVSEGDAMLIPAYTRFLGRHGGGDENYTGVAQHFSLELFSRGDMIQSMSLRRRVRLSDWDSFKSLITLYRDKSSAMTTTLQQHHQFMVILLAFLRDAFVDWRNAPDSDDPQDQLSMQIMLVASRLSTDPLGNVAEEVLANVPYNADYFRRAFRDRIGMTPQKYRESKRMEFALHRLQMGATVKSVSAELGFRDPYFFSRQFKRHVGASPSRYRAKRNGGDDA